MRKIVDNVEEKMTLPQFMIIFLFYLIFGQSQSVNKKVKGLVQ